MDRYTTTLAGVKDTLAQYGVAIIPNVLTARESQEIVDEMWKGLAHISSAWKTPLSRDNRDSWKSMQNFDAMRGMLIQYHSIGHLQAAWDVRQHAGIISVFEALWGTRDLLTSFDGLSVSFPPEATGRGWGRKNSLELHSDTSFFYLPGSRPKDTFDCVQSWFTPIEVREGDATLAFLEGSHVYHRQFGVSQGIQDKTDWYKLSPDQLAVYTQQYGCPLGKITCPAGSVVLWDSRTIHCGAQPEKTRPQENFRFCFYVCMLPRNFANSKQLAKRLEIFEMLRLTRHHPVKVTMFGKNPRIYSKDQVREVMTPPARPRLTEIGRRLIGYEHGTAQVDVLTPTGTLEALSDDVFGDILLLLPWRNIMRLSVTHYYLNDRIYRVLNTAWWRRKLAIDYPTRASLPLLPNEAYMLHNARLIPQMQYALQYNPAMLTYVNSLRDVTIPLSSDEIIFLLRQQQYDILWRAVQKSRHFPVSVAYSVDPTLSLLEPMFDTAEMNADMIDTLVQDIVQDPRMPREILRVLAAHPVAARSRIFATCLALSRSDDTSCMMVLEGLLRAGNNTGILTQYLYAAVMNRREDLVDRLLTAGADPNDPAVPNGYRPLDDAVFLRDETIARMLSVSPLYIHGDILQENVARTRGTLRVLVHQLITAGKIRVVTHL